MKPRLFVVVAFWLLACPTLAWANVAVYVFENDPGYRQTALAHGMIAFSLCMMAVLGCWFADRRSGAKQFLSIGLSGIGSFLLLGYFLVTMNLHWKSGDRPAGFTGPFRQFGQAAPENANQPFSPPLVGLLLAGVVTVAGWWLSRSFRVKQAPSADGGAESVVVPDAR